MGYQHNPENAVVDEFYASMAELDVAYDMFRHAPVPFESLHPTFQRGVAANVLPFLIAEAHRARERAISHRQFRVGAAALVLYWRDGREYQRYVHGANMKPDASDEINIHAEHAVMHDIEKYMYPGDKISVPALVVIGDYQHDQQSGQQTRTLHPCGKCRDDFVSFEPASFEQTLFMTARDNLQIFEWFYLKQLLALHQSGGEEFSYAEFDHPIFQPRRNSTSMRETEEETRDVDLFNEAVVMPIMRGEQSLGVRAG